VGLPEGENSIVMCGLGYRIFSLGTGLTSSVLSMDIETNRLTL